ncbi:hypothetical protein L914_16499 [Phytophthora nicotianae]|uniref:Uncharacterized protein n=1 Tax=Phytophthora nicotianae TaxID=4792 RepID=W2MKM4_PHYNI|nr:hypothetical protein L914_16499 [Phytophthora nicotianae]
MVPVPKLTLKLLIENVLGKWRSKEHVGAERSKADNSRAQFWFFLYFRQPASLGDRPFACTFLGNNKTVCTWYALLRPDSLETTGYAYGKTVSDAEHSQVGVERVSSGRWKDLGVCTTKKEIAGVGFRTVIEEGAMSGIGTYVGGAVCIARVPKGKPKVWDYGIVVGYSWKDG